MAKVDFTKEQEKAIFKHIAYNYRAKSCHTCSHEAGNLLSNLSKTCEKCDTRYFSNWSPNSYIRESVKEEIELIKKNKKP